MPSPLPGRPRVLSLNKSFITDTVSFFQGVPAARAPQVNRITMRYLEDYDVLSPLYCATKLLQLGKYYAEFAAGISQVLAMEGGFGWVQVGDPDAADLEHHEECCRSCIPHLHLLGEEAKAAVEEAKQVLTGPWKGHTVFHVCRLIPDPEGGAALVPCCKTRKEAFLKVRKAVLGLALKFLPDTPCATRWLTFYKCHGFWTLGVLLNSIFPRAWLRFDPTASACRSDISLEGRLLNPHGDPPHHVESSEAKGQGSPPTRAYSMQHKRRLRLRPGYAPFAIPVQALGRRWVDYRL